MPILFVAAGGTAVVALRLLSRLLRRQNTHKYQDDHFFADDEVGSSLQGSYLSRGSGASRSTTSARSLRQGSCENEKERPANQQQQPSSDVSGQNATCEVRANSDGEAALEANEGPSGGQLGVSEARRRAASIRKVREWDDAGESADCIPTGSEGGEHSSSHGGGSSSSADERDRALLPVSAGTSPSSSLHRQTGPTDAPPISSRRPLPPPQLPRTTTPPTASNISKSQATMPASSGEVSSKIPSTDQPQVTDHEPLGCGAGSSLLGNCSRGSGTDASIPGERSSGTGTATLVSGTGTLTSSASPNTSHCTEAAEQRSESDSERGPSGSQGTEGKGKGGGRGKPGVQAGSAGSVAVEVLAAGKADQVVMLAAGSGRVMSGGVAAAGSTRGVHKELPLALQSPASPVAEPAPLPPTILPTRAPDPDRLHAMQMQVEALRLQHLQRQAAALLTAPATSRPKSLLSSVSAPIPATSSVSKSGAVTASVSGAASNPLSLLHDQAPQSTLPEPARHSTSLGSWLLLHKQQVPQPQTGYIPGAAAAHVAGGGGGSSVGVSAAVVVVGSGQQLSHAAQQQLVRAPSEQLQQQQQGPQVTWPQQAVTSVDASGVSTDSQAQPLLQQPQQQHLPLQQLQQQHLQPVMPQAYHTHHTSPPHSQALPVGLAATTEQLKWPDAAVQAARMSTLQRPPPPQPAPKTFLPASFQQRQQQQQQGLSNDQTTCIAAISPLRVGPHAGWADNSSQPGAGAQMVGMNPTANSQQQQPQPKSLSRLSPEVEAVIALAAAAAAGLIPSPPTTPTTSSYHHTPTLHHSPGSKQILNQELQELSQQLQQPQQQQYHHKHHTSVSSPTQAHTNGRTSATSSPSLSSLPGGEASLGSPPSFRQHLPGVIGLLQESESVKRTQDWLYNTPMRSLEATKSAPGLRLAQGQEVLQVLRQASTSNLVTGKAGWNGGENSEEPSSPFELRPHPTSFTDVSTTMGLLMAGGGVLRTEPSVTGQGGQQSPRLRTSSSSRYGSPVGAREDSLWRYGSKRRSTTGTSSHGSRHTSTHGSHRRRSSATRRAREQQALVQQKLMEEGTRPPSPLAQYSARLMQEAVEKQAAPIPRMPNGGAFFVPLKHEIRLELSSERPNSTGDTTTGSRQSTATGTVTTKAPSSSAGPASWGRQQ